MISALQHYYLARLTLEAITPLSVAAGGSDGVFDIILARDANNLPIIPGTAIAGVLRHLFWHIHGEQAMQKLFGSQQDDTGNPSLLRVSWGCIQDSQQRPVEGLLLNGINDKLLQTVLGDNATPPTRDRVCINHRGSATNHGKFDRTVLPAGHRFSAELVLWSDQTNDPRWQQILDLLQHPLFRLGGGTRAGFGRLKPISIHAGQFDLKTPAGRAAFLQLAAVVPTPTKEIPKRPQPKKKKSVSESGVIVVEILKTTKPEIATTLPPGSIGATAGLTPLSLASGSNPFPDFVTMTLKLTPHGFWRIGQGEPTVNSKIDSNGKLADMLPKLESRIVWDDGDGKVGPVHLLVPATSFKGTLSHRVAFHANRRAGRWATQAALNKDREYHKENCPEVRELFGFVETKSSNADAVARVGRVMFDDCFVKFTMDDLKLMMHNAIDRFTGGVREHMLFMEELVWNKNIEITGVIATKGITNNARAALLAALYDLCQGRLSLGAGIGKGHGLFSGEIEWSDGGTWINTVIPEQSQNANTNGQAA